MHRLLLASGSWETLPWRPLFQILMYVPSAMASFEGFLAVWAHLALHKGKLIFGDMAHHLMGFGIICKKNKNKYFHERDTCHSGAFMHGQSSFLEEIPFIIRVVWRFLWHDKM